MQCCGHLAFSGILNAWRAQLTHQSEDSTSVQKAEAYLYLLLFQIKKTSFHYLSTFKVFPHSFLVLKS